jgi:hypothetical protein
VSGQTRLRRQSACLSLILLLVSTLLAFAVGRAQQDAPAWLDEAARRTGLSREELLRRLAQGQGFEPTLPVDTTATTEPGRKDLSGIDDSRPRRPGPRVILPFDLAAAETVAAQPCPLVPDSLRMPLEDQIFGSEFFQLDAGVFNPTTFGPVPQDYRIGVGDQIVVDVWGEVEFRLERVVDRDGSIILPKGGKIFCADLTLADVAQKVRERLSRSYSGISPRPGEGSTFLDVSLGQLRAIRFRIHHIHRPVCGRWANGGGFPARDPSHAGRPEGGRSGFLRLPAGRPARR